LDNAESVEELSEKLVIYIRRKFYTRRNIADAAGEIVNQAFLDVIKAGVLETDKCNFGYMSRACVRVADGLKEIAGLARAVKFLSVNAELEIMRMAGISMDFNIPKSMAVFADELRGIAVSLEGLTDGNKKADTLLFPEFAEYSEPPSYGSYFSYSVGGRQFLEKCENVLEVCYSRKADIENGAFSLRGAKVPVIDCFRRFGLKNQDTSDFQTVLIVDTGMEKSIIAVPADDLDINTIFYSRAGKDVPVENGRLPAGCAREYWDAAGGGQYIFMDWEKLSGGQSQH
jgi:hypothetical protein